MWDLVRLRCYRVCGVCGLYCPHDRYVDAANSGLSVSSPFHPRVAYYVSTCLPLNLLHTHTRTQTIRSLPRGLGGARSMSALAGHRSVGQVGRSSSSALPPLKTTPGSGADGLAPLVVQCRHAKRWEAEPFRNLITFRLDPTRTGVPGGGQGKGRKVRGRGLKKKQKEEEEEDEAVGGVRGAWLPSAHSKVKVKESALRLRQALHLRKESDAEEDSEGRECGNGSEEYDGPQVDCRACAVPIKPEWERCPLCSKFQKVVDGKSD